MASKIVLSIIEDEMTIHETLSKLIKNRYILRQKQNEVTGRFVLQCWPHIVQSRFHPCDHQLCLRKQLKGSML
jgi:hypothetical protein